MIIRVIAAIFSQGYGMHDDHFLIVEAASSWVDGYDYNGWLPWSPDNRGGPEGHSFTYVGANFIYFYCMKAIGIVDPKILMLVNRLVHALFSLLIVHYGFKIAKKIADEKTATTVGWMLALLWMLPFLSVRNLVEIVCIPFILGSVWFMLKSENRWHFLLAGLMMGMAISIRYQVAVFALVFAAVYFFRFLWPQFLLYCAGVVLIFLLTQGLVDYLIWGYPFAEFIGYFTYNSNEGTEYIPNNNYFMYLLVLIGACLFPLGVLIGVGFFARAKKYLFIFLPVLAFILFHSLYPSKQERFILPVLPLFMILGVAGYFQIVKPGFWTKFWRFSYGAFWAINIPLLVVISVAYSKQSRVEAMYYFYENGETPQKILLEATGETGTSMPPKFYSGSWRFGILERTDTTQLMTVYEGYNYDFICFYGEKDLDKRVAAYKKIYPSMELGKKCNPSFVDLFLRWLNPRNRNEYIEVWKTHATPS